MAFDTQVLRSISDTNANRWNNFVRQSDRGTIYHTVDWLESIETAADADPRHVLVEQNGGIVGVCPSFRTEMDRGPLHRLLSTPHGLGGPLMSNDREAVLDGILNRLDSCGTAGTAVSTFLMEGASALSYRAQLAECGYRAELSGKYVVELDSWEAVRERLSKDRRYELRKATDQSFAVEKLPAERTVLSTVCDHYRETVDEGGISPEFLQTVAERAPDSFLITTAVVDGERRGYHVYVTDDVSGRLRHLIAAVAAEDYEHYPSQLLHRHGMRHAIDEGYDYYDMGGTVVDHRDSVSSYKRQYGGRIEPVMTFESGISPTSLVYRFGRLLLEANRE